MEGFSHSRPKEQNAERPTFHQIDLGVDGKNVGFAWFQYYSKPMPLYFVAQLWVNEEDRGKGYGSKLVERIEGMLKEKGKVGILREGIDQYEENAPEARGMYARRGWQQIPDVGDGRWYVYNLPDGVSPEKLADFPKRLHTTGRNERLDARYDDVKA